MKVTLDYTTRKATITETKPVFQHSHNIDVVQIALDFYDSSKVYKLNFKDASDTPNLSRNATYIGTVNDLHYFRILLNKNNTAYDGNLTMSFAIYAQTTVGEATITSKVWNSESFVQYIEPSESDTTVDIDDEEESLIDEIYAAIGLKLNITAKGHFFAVADLGITGTKTTLQYITGAYAELIDDEGDYLFSGSAMIKNDGVTISDAPGDETLLFLSTNDQTDNDELTAIIFSTDLTTAVDLHYAILQDGSLSAWKRILNDTDLTAITTSIGLQIPKTYLDTDGTLSANSDLKIATQKATKTYADAKHALAAKLAGGNTFSGNQILNDDLTVLGAITASGGIDADDEAITGLPAPTADTHAARKKYVDDADALKLDLSGGTMGGAIDMATSKVLRVGDGTLSGDAVNFGQLEAVKEDLTREIERLDGRGKSYGEVDKTTAELTAMNASERAGAIAEYIEEQEWFTEVAYVASAGNLVYDKGTGDGVAFHEWEYNGDDWVDNGMIDFGKATNAIYGKVKGDTTKVNIVDGDIEVIEAENANYVLDTASTDRLSYQQIVDAFTARYTKTEVNNLLDQLKAVYGWENELIATLIDAQNVSLASIADYDFIIFQAEYNDGSRDFFDSQIVRVSDIESGYNLQFQHTTDGEFGNLAVSDIDIEFTEVEANSSVKVIGLKMSGFSAENITTDFDGTNYLDAEENVEDSLIALDTKIKTNADTKSNKSELRQVGTTSIVYVGGKITTITSDDVVTSLEYNDNTISKISETYADGKTYETTYAKDVDGRIKNITKVEV